jgi:hypothetical protein
MTVAAAGLAGIVACTPSGQSSDQNSPQNSGSAPTQKEEIVPRDSTLIVYAGKGTYYKLKGPGDFVVTGANTTPALASEVPHDIEGACRQYPLKPGQDRQDNTNTMPSYKVRLSGNEIASSIREWRRELIPTIAGAS